MTPDIEIMRDHVAGMYPGPRWRAKVLKMPDAQVIAIFMREQKKEQEAARKPKESSDGEGDFPF